MPPKPPVPASSESESTESETDSDSEYTDSDISTPKNAPTKKPSLKPSGAGLKGPADETSAAVRFMDDDELNEKMRRAQERLQGLDNHVADLKKRSTEHDAMSKGKLPPEQTAAYLEKVKSLEAKRRELLERQMDVGEKLQRAATTNGTLNQHRHGGTPRVEREHNRSQLVARLRREESAARERLAAYKGGSGWNEADALHNAAVAQASAEEAEAAAEAEHMRERERLASLGGRRHALDEDDDAPAPAQRGGGAPGMPSQRKDSMRQSNQMSFNNRSNRNLRDSYDDENANGRGNRGNDNNQNQNPYGNMHQGNMPPYGMHPGMNPMMNPYGMMGGMMPGMMGGMNPYGMQPYGQDPYAQQRDRDRDDRRQEDSKKETPDYASALKTQVDELQKSLASLLELAKKGGGLGGGGGSDSSSSNVRDLPQLPDEIKDDAEIKSLYAQHMREMLKMQLNIGRESRAVELERLRTEMLQLKDGTYVASGGGGGGGAPPPQQQQMQYPPPYPYPPPQYGHPPPGYPRYGQTPYPGVLPPYGQSPMYTNDGQQRGPGGVGGVDETPGMDGPMDGPPGGPMGGPMDGMDGPPGVPPLDGMKTPVPLERGTSKRGGSKKGNLDPVAEGEDKSDYTYGSGSDYGSDYGSEDSYMTDDSRDRLRRGLGRDFPRVTVRVMMEGAGPMDLKDSPARLVAALYEGHEPAMDASGAPLRSRGPLMEPSSHDRGGAARYKWRARVSLRGVQVTAATKLVLELHAAHKIKDDGYGGGGWSLGSEEVVAWAHIPVFDANGETPSGLQVTPLLQLPLMLSAERTQRLEGSRVEIRVWTEPENNDRSPSPPGTPRVGGGVAGGHLDDPMGGAVTEELQPSWLKGGGAAQAEVEANRKEDVPGVPRKAWREVRHVGAGGAGGKGEAFQPGDGLVFCVDAVRFLPPNVTITRVVGRVISAAGEQLAPDFIINARLNSLAFSPRFHNRQRFATGRWNNATATALLQIETIEKGTSAQRTVGYVVFPFFVDPDTGEPPTTSTQRGYRLKEGGWQIPVYAASATTSGSGFSLKEVVSRAKIPCASVLVRALVATRADAPANKAVPQYEDGAYDSSMTYPVAVERRLFAHRLSQPGPPVREAMLDLARKTFSPNVLSGMTETDLERWMAKRLEKPEFSNEKPLNYRRSDPYVPDLGFHTAVDGAFRLPKAAFHVAVTSLFPPGTFYSSKASDDVVFTQNPEISSLLQAPRWLDGFHARQHVIHEPNLVVIVDVRALVGKNTQPAGWAILPVFEEGSEFLASGVFQLPLFQGPVPLPLLQDLVKGQAEGKGVLEIIGSWLDDKKVKFTADKSSVFVRLLEDQRLGMLPDPAGPSTPGVVFPNYVGAKLEPAFVKKSAGKPYAKNVTRGTTAKEYVTESNALSAASLGLPYVRGQAAFGAGASVAYTDSEAGYTDSASYLS